MLDSGNLLALEISHFETDIGFREHQASFQQPVTLYVETHLRVLMDVLGQVVKLFPKISIPVGNGNRHQQVRKVQLGASAVGADKYI